jgi:hypothetical protein
LQAAGTERECSDFGYAVGNNDAGKGRAACKSFAPDCGKPRGQGNGGKTLVILLKALFPISLTGSPSIVAGTVTLAAWPVYFVMTTPSPSPVSPTLKSDAAWANAAVPDSSSAAANITHVNLFFINKHSLKKFINHKVKSKNLYHQGEKGEKV